eukprot:CAMPEP_0194336006 /NCGR_PEP_ID=MMETSP0171-20130528/71537_1 /TAXON_ID=218684 /ORGANISM="Corethron pennatum, Strain L29A3" /LENGTH=100 /DNA_ID=CAMNT_0039099311 /DNA_START=167 /DNA_END=469 /DNA_ORIENTATION=+
MQLPDFVQLLLGIAVGSVVLRVDRFHGGAPPAEIAWPVDVPCGGAFPSVRRPPFPSGVRRQDGSSPGGVPWTGAGRKRGGGGPAALVGAFLALSSGAEHI